MNDAEAIRDYRTRLHLSQRQLAELAGVCLDTVSNIERGLVTPTFHTAVSIQAALALHAMRAGLPILRLDAAMPKLHYPRKPTKAHDYRAAR